MSELVITDGEMDVTADELKLARLDVLEEKAGGGHLRHIPRRSRDDEMPRLTVFPEALAALRELCQSMRKDMGGYRPDITMAASALILDLVSRPEDAKAVIAEFGFRQFEKLKAKKATTTETIEES